MNATPDKMDRATLGPAEREGRDRHGRFDRRELKFVITRAQREAMLPALQERLTPDPFGDVEGRYAITSVYYDSPNREAYFERARGVTPRHKLRLRAYAVDEPAEAVFVEIKTKLKRRVVKRRVPLDRLTAQALCHGARPDEPLAPLESLFVEDVLRMVDHRRLEPAMWLRYDRQAFTDPEGSGLRVTFDTDVAYRARDPEDLSCPIEDGWAIADDEAVLEIKVDDAVPVWLTRLVGREALTLQPFSKYCRSLELAGDLGGAAPTVQTPREVALPSAIRAPAWKPSPSSSAS